MSNRPEKSEEEDLTLHKIRGNTKMKEVYNEVKKPNGALLMKAPKDNVQNDIKNLVKSSKILKDDKNHN